MSAISSALKSAGKLRLARSIEQNWHKTCLAYSKELNFWRPKRPMEPELHEAFLEELERLDFDPLSRKQIVDSIQRRRILQTAPHLVATEGPRMLCINWLGSLGVPPKEFYVVGMFSGIPFSNRFRPGRINRKNDSINLFPSSLQDGLVYRSIIPEKFRESMAGLSRKITKFFPFADPGHSYTKWALQSCQHIERQILKKDNLVYLDINEVVGRYLVKVLKNHSHIMHKILFNPVVRKEFMHRFPNEILFYAPVINGKYEKMENMRFKKTSLKSKNAEIPLDPETIIRELEEGRLCPSLIVTFMVLAFINQFKCFGSFAQVEYLPVYQQKLAKLKAMKGFSIDSIATSNLTTGSFPGQKDFFPIDIITEEKKWKPDEKMLFGELIVPIQKTLMESYFIGDDRNSHDPSTKTQGHSEYKSNYEKKRG